MKKRIIKIIMNDTNIKKKRIDISIHENLLKQWDDFRQNKLGGMTRTNMIKNAVRIYMEILTEQLNGGSDKESDKQLEKNTNNIIKEIEKLYLEILKLKELRENSISKSDFNELLKTSLLNGHKLLEISEGLKEIKKNLN